MKKYLVMAVILGFVAHSMANQASQAIGKHHVKIEAALEV